ncbi:tail fiber domain-containing protein [Bdellovibrio sp. HCB185ZH]|uniref:tail fiber domain-containing protein n=1 Tax=Bdellovibrio sp. HCB185ZH TaxID=3394235 RepID=UPI0039A699BA
MKMILLISALMTLMTKAAFAVSPGSLLTYEGLLTDSTGTPITTTQTVGFQILYGACVMYSETQSVAPGSAGEFSVIVGTGTRVDTTNNTADRIFASAGSVNCNGSSAATMTGFATRVLRISVNGVDLTPDVQIGNIPVSINSQKLADKSASEFLQVNSSMTTTQANLESILSRYTTLNNLLSAYAGNTLTAQSAQTAVNFTGALTGDVSGTQAATSVDKIKGVAIDTTGIATGKVLKYDGAKWAVSDDATGTSPGDASYTAKGLVQPMTDAATSGILISSGVIKVNYGTAANQIVKLDASAKLPAVDGSQLTGILPTGASTGQVLTSNGSTLSWTTPSTTDASKLPLAGGTMTGAISMGGNNITNIGFITMNAGGQFHLSNNSVDPSLSTADKGKVWFNSTSNQIKYWDGSATQTLGVAGAGLTSLNGQSGSAQTFGTPTTAGTSLSWNSASNNHVLNIPMASTTGVTAGLLSKADYDSFNAKQAAGNYISSLTGDITATGPGSASATIANGVVTSAKIADGTIVGTDLNFTGMVTATSGIVIQDSTGKFSNFGCSTAGHVPTWTVTGWICSSLDPANLSAVVPITKGGTGASTASGAFTALSPMASKGDLISHSGSATSVLNVGTTGQILAADSAQTTGLKWITPTYFANGGNTFGADATLGLADAYGLSIKTNSATRLHINASGYVGIGATANTGVPLTVSSALAAGTALHLVNTNSSRNYSFNTGSLSSTYGASAFALNDETAGKTRFLIDTTGAASLGGTITNMIAAAGPGVLTLNGPGTTPSIDSGVLELNNNAATVAAGTSGGRVTFNAYNNLGAKSLASIQVLTDGSGGANGYGGRIMFTTKADNSTSQGINFIMTSTGNVGIGTGVPAYRLDVSGDANLSSGSVYRIAGTQICTASGCLSSSDRRLKENIQPLQNSLENILKIDAVSYDYIDKQRFGDKHQVGVIAQDVEKIYPEVVVTDEKTGYKAVAYDHLVAPLIDAVKSIYYKVTSSEEKIAEHDRRIASVEEQKTLDRAEIEKLKAENETLKKQNENLQKDLNLIKSKLGL